MTFGIFFLIFIAPFIMLGFIYITPLMVFIIFNLLSGHTPDRVYREAQHREINGIKKNYSRYAHKRM